MTDVFGVSLEVETSGMQNGDAALDKLAKSGDKVDKSLDRVDKSVDELNKDLAKTKPIADSATKSIIGMDSAATKTAKGFHLQKGASQQLGYQLQDMAVQAQMGISPFTILGQQGSQLAMVLGPQGALIGAVIAIGAAMGGVLSKAFANVSESSKEIKERIEAVTKSFQDLDKAQKAFLSQDAEAMEKSLLVERVDTRGEIKDLEIKLNQVTRAREKSYDKIREGFILSKSERAENVARNKEIKELTENLVILRAKLSTINAEISKSESNISEIIGAGYSQAIQNQLDAIKITSKAEQEKWKAIKEGTKARKEELAIIQEIADTSNHLLTIEMSSKDAAIAKGRAQETVLKNQRMSAAESAISSAITSGKTALELENERYQESLKLVREYADEKRWGDDKRRETEILLETEHQAKLLEIEKKGVKDRVATDTQLFTNLSMAADIYSNINNAIYAKQRAQLANDLANKENFSAAEIAIKEKTAKALFEKQKNADLLSIALSTSKGVATQLGMGNFGMAALVGAQGAAQFAAASALQYGGSGSAPSSGNVAEAPPSVQNNNNNSGGNIVNITLNNANSGATDLEALKEFFQADGVLFDINTAQGELLR